MEIEQCVILFDKIEEFCLHRKFPGVDTESRMLITTMLTAINNLLKKKQSTYFVVNNWLHAFDPGITRSGRFGM